MSGTVSATYTYNANRQRTSKTVNGQTTYYLYNQSWQLLAELDHSGQTKVEYVWLGTQPLAVIHSGPASAVAYYIHTDHLNTPQVVSDNQGTVVWRADYDAFGQAAVASGSILTFNLRFPGQYFDSETGLHYNYYRDYDPSTGRYLQSDPIGVLRDYSSPQLQLVITNGMLEATGTAGELLNHIYGYVGQNPLGWFDPYGLAKNKNKARPENPNRRKGAEDRGKSGSRERNIGHPEGEEHSRRPKGGVRFRMPLMILHLPPKLIDEIFMSPMDPMAGVPHEC